MFFNQNARPFPLLCEHLSLESPLQSESAVFSQTRRATKQMQTQCFSFVRTIFLAYPRTNPGLVNVSCLPVQSLFVVCDSTDQGVHQSSQMHFRQKVNPLCQIADCTGRVGSGSELSPGGWVITFAMEVVPNLEKFKKGTSTSREKFTQIETRGDRMT